MAQPSTRQELKEYTLRQLGYPVIQINVADEQLEDLLDDAIQVFNEDYFDGVIRYFHSYQITQTDIDNGYIELPEWILSVLRVFPLANSNIKGMFDVRYQLRLQDVFAVSRFEISNYELVMQHLNLIEHVLSGDSSFEFNRLNSNRLYIHVNWDEAFDVDNYIMLDTYRTVDPTTHANVWNDRFLKMYYTALVKRQWGNNLKKFSGVQMIGGVELNGQQIYDEAKQELDEVMELMETKFTAPPRFFSG